MIKDLAAQIKKARSLILSTHRQCDGDGLGAQLGLYHTLKAAGKDVRIINVDATPKKYRFLNPDQHIQYFEDKADFVGADLALIFDTNDERLVEPLFGEMKKKVSQVAFVDHHPLLKKGPQPTVGSWIDVTAASTGELAFRLIKELGCSLNREAARALYTSITFDTQLYRFIRNSPSSHLIAAELLQFEIGIEEIHRHLFGHQTVQKMAFLAKALSEIEYFCEGRLAVLRLSDHDLLSFGLEPDESRDVIDLLMTIETLEAAALFREDAPESYKVSFRSKGQIEVLSAAENLGGGGHLYAAGAFVRSAYAPLKANVIKDLSEKLSKTSY
ncbi:MAG: DHH family phosphoesterase [Proteobacteria bacterium]|nr:DHH family phosphoesterase [Pseudomonadota bacterium]